MELHNYFRSSASWRVRIALALKGLQADYLPVHLLKNEQSSPEFVAASGTGLVPLLVTDDGLRLHQSLAIIEYLDETVPEPPLLPRDAAGRARVRALALKGLDYDYVPVHLLKNEQTRPGIVAASSNGLVPLLVTDDDQPLHQSLAIIEYLDETVPEPPLLPPDALGRARVRALALDIACEIHPLNNLRVLRYLVRTAGLDEDAKNAWMRHWMEDGLVAVERQLVARPSAFCHGDAPTLADCVLVPQVFNAQRFEAKLDHVPNVMRVFAHCMALPAFQQAQPSACPDAE